MSTEVEVSTSLGNFVVELYHEDAPRYVRVTISVQYELPWVLTHSHSYTHCRRRRHHHRARSTCQNFETLAKNGYYNNTVFHRIIRDFMIQGGDPTATGRGGRSIYGDRFDDEPNSLKHVGAGVLSMANAGPNTNGSQFFITLAPCAHLDGRHTIFGRVCRGMEVIKRIGNVQTDRNDRPTQDVTILNCNVL